METNEVTAAPTIPVTIRVARIPNTRSIRMSPAVLRARLRAVRTDPQYRRILLRIVR